MIRFTSIILLATAFFANVSAALAAEYWVAPSGSDSALGSASSPFRSIEKGLSVARAGDTVILKPGEYYRGGDVSFPRSGQQDSPIVLRAEFPAVEHPSSKWSTLTGRQEAQGILIRGKSHIVVDGLAVRNFTVGMRARSGANNIVFRRNVLENNQAIGIHTWQEANNVLIERNRFIDFALTGETARRDSNGRMDYGVQVRTSSRNRITNNHFTGRFNHNIALKGSRARYGDNADNYIGYNTFEGCHFECIVVGQSQDGTWEDNNDATTIDTIIEHNVFRDVTVNGTYYRIKEVINIRNAANTVVRSNLLEGKVLWSAISVQGKAYPGSTSAKGAFGVKPTGAEIYGNTIIGVEAEAIDIDSRGHSDDRINVFNNTIHRAGRGLTMESYLDGERFSGMETSAPPEVRFYNNIVSMTDTGASGSLANAEFRTNNWYRSGATRHSSDRADDPLFVDPQVWSGASGSSGGLIPDFSRRDGFALRSGSPLLNAGTDVGLPFAGDAPDIGSGEFHDLKYDSDAGFSPCSLIRRGARIAAGFAAPYNVFSATGDLLLAVACSQTAARLTVGSGAQNEYVYNRSYTWRSGSWQPLTLDGANQVGGAWYVGRASTKLPHTANELSGNNVVIAYVCIWTGNAWKCGCRDQACAQNLWLFQAFRR